MVEEVEVVIADDALVAILEIGSKADLAKIRRRLETLAFAPEMGVTYEPVHEAARLDHDVLVTYAGRYGIYYTYDQARRRVEIEFVCNERRNPAHLFSQPWGNVEDVE